MALSEEQLLGLGPEPVEQPEEKSFIEEITDWFSSIGEEEAVSKAISEKQELPPVSLSADQMMGLEDPTVVDKIKQEEERSNFTDVAAGMASGLLAIPQGIGELGGSVIDLIFDTDTSRSVTETFEDIRQAADIDPQGTAGEIAEALVQFGIPGLGAASAVSKVSKAAKLAQVGGPASARALLKSSVVGREALKAEMLKQSPAWTARLQQVGAAAAADFAVSTDGTTTIGDFFEGGPTQTDKSVGLEGREEALRRITNKLKIGAEAATVVGALPLAGEAVATAGGLTAKGIAEAGELTGASKVAKKGLEKLGTFFDESQFSSNDLRRKLNDYVFKNLRSRGNLSQEAYDARVHADGSVSSQMEFVDRNIKQLGRLLDGNIKKKLFKAHRASNDELTANEIYNLVEAALAKEIREEIPGFGKNVSIQDKLADLVNFKLDQAGYVGKREWVDELADVTKRARKHIDDLSKEVADQPGIVSKLEDTIRANVGSYLTRVYRVHTDKNWAKYVKKQKPELIENAKAYLAKQAKVNGKTLTDEELDGLIEGILNVNPGTVTGTVDESVLSRLKGAGVLEKKLKIDDSIRALMGEVKDPRSHYAYTISKLSNYLADTKFHNAVVKDGLDNGYIYASKADVPPELQRDFVELIDVDPVKFGALAGKTVRKDMWKEINRSSRMYDQDRNLFFSLYASTFLPLKGMSQYSKTVLSPITQLRNFNTATFFAMAQGNVGRGANVRKSYQYVIDAIKKKAPSEKLDYYRKMQELGIVNTNVQVEEMRRLIDEELALGDPAMFSLTKLFGGNVPGTTGGFRSNPAGYVANKFRKIPGVNLAQDLYQGTDDIWKIYNFEFEKTKYMQAGLDEAAATTKAADIVRNTVPNYSAVPEFVKQARLLPLGNFISFPAEILRTGYNTMKYAVDELASDDAAIRAIGARRLMGLTSVTYAIPASVSYMAQNATGISQDEMDAIKRSFAPEWQRNSELIPLGRNAKGNVTYMDFSYLNPYDYLQRPGQGFMNEWQNGTLRGDDIDQRLLKAGVESLGEFFKPFTDPSIMTEKLMSSYDGVNPDGRKVWRENDPIGTKIAKSFFYIADGIIPPVVPIDTKGAPETLARGDAVETGRFFQALSSAAGLGEDMDYKGNKRRLDAELLRVFTGVTEFEANPKKSLKYAGFEHGSALSDATNTFTSALTRGGRFTDEQAIEAYRTANEMRYRAFAKMHQKVVDAKSLGINDADIYTAISKIGDRKAIFEGRYIPWFPKKQSIAQIMSYPEDVPADQRNELPIEKMLQVYDEFLDKPLEVTVPNEEPVQVVPTAPVTTAPRQPAQQQSAPVAQTSVTAPASQGIASMQMSQRPYTPAEMSALGLSPLEQAIKEKQQIGVA